MEFLLLSQFIYTSPRTTSWGKPNFFYTGHNTLRNSAFRATSKDRNKCDANCHIDSYTAHSVVSKYDNLVVHAQDFQVLTEIWHEYHKMWHLCQGKLYLIRHCRETLKIKNYITDRIHWAVFSAVDFAFFHETYPAELLSLLPRGHALPISGKSFLIWHQTIYIYCVWLQYRDFLNGSSNIWMNCMSHITHRPFHTQKQEIRINCRLNSGLWFLHY